MTPERVVGVGAGAARGDESRAATYDSASAPTSDFLASPDGQRVVERMARAANEHISTRTFQLDGVGKSFPLCACGTIDYDGTHRTVEVLRAVLSDEGQTCEECSGTKQVLTTVQATDGLGNRHDQVVGTAPCSVCEGRGTVPGLPLLIPRSVLDQTSRALGWALQFVTGRDRKSPEVAQVYEQARAAHDESIAALYHIVPAEET